MIDTDKIFCIKNFTDHPINYQILVDFWKHSFIELTGISGESYITNQFGNGKDILDGNPIFTAKLNAGKGVRIIQIEQDIEQPILSSWINKTIIDNNDFEELVIALQLKSETYLDAKQLVISYFNDALTEFILLGINQKYEINQDLGKIAYIINLHDYFQVFTDFQSIYESSLENMEFNFETIRKFPTYYLDAELYSSSNKKSPIQRSFQIFVENMAQINNLLSLKDTVDLKEINDKNEYVLLITFTWGSTKEYIEKLHSYTSKAEEEYEYIKDHLHI